MHGPALVENLNDELNILAQLPLLNIYTQICCCFPVADASSQAAIINTLTNGLERMCASFPWLAGQVVNEGSGENSSGIFKIKPLDKIPPLVVKDLRHDSSMPSMDTLRRANFPVSMLDETVIAPRKTIPRGPDKSASNSAPVFLLQANFITGGLLLTFVGQHNAMDMTGQGRIIHLFSKACRNELFTGKELASGNLLRRNLIPLLDDSYEPGSELAHQIVRRTRKPSGNPPPSSFQKPTWAYFIFQSTSLTTLKSLASETIPLSSGYISTDDTLSAFIWQSIIRARLPRLNPAVESTLARAVDVRRFLDVPETYPGHMQNMIYHTSTLQKLVDEPLGAIASRLRSALDPKTSNIAYNTCALATFLHRTPDKSIASFIATLDFSTDIILSSWAKLDCYELDFNLGMGKPEAVRRPHFRAVEGAICLLPRTLDGEIAAAVCLRDEDMERLKADEEFVKYGRYIG
ncbi:hypothetical protein PRK78_000155 [Emydomyces testavorans]|uniref:Trichothecene 3-O-acetyltransferase-like N-terminal domain-containing protein n=1 Tax=Emydomyces testavorans TaxID=2070801 RepID=A0AAF0IE59_9EURO|nr:hypothetical protein PRK78_000155 [Emydomyces testavorans]